MRSLAIIYLLAAALAAFTTILAVGYAMIGARLPALDRLIIAVGALTAGFFLVLTMLAIAELLKLFIDVEHNTRVAGVAHMGGMNAVGMTTAAAPPAGETVAAAPADGNAAARTATRMEGIDDETAEAALLRGH